MKTNLKLKKANSYRLNQEKLRNKALIKGVNLLAPETIFLSSDTVFGKNITLEPYVVIGPKVKIGNNTIIKSFDNSFLMQDKDNSIFDRKKLKFVTTKKPTKKEIDEIEFAFNICKFVKSNAIVLTNNSSTIGIGAGQPSRLDSCKIATQKAKTFKKNKLDKAIAASDAFFPFADGIKTLINSGVKIIVQPGGSIRDQEVINAANKAKIKMIFTGIRHFNH